MPILCQAKGADILGNTPAYSTATSRPTILIFDSSVGGLSVYQEVRNLLPNLHYIYTFDNVAFPYGEKSEEFIIKRVLKITSAVQQSHSIVMGIIACNTASTIALSVLRASLTFPIVGVVPAIKPAARITVNGIVGVLATRGTVKHSYTHELIDRFATNCRIELLSSAKLVELAEAKLHGITIPLITLKQILDPWLKMIEPPDTVVLGCTHFPFLAEELTRVLPEGTCLVDSGSAIARRTAWLLSRQKTSLSTQEDNLAYCMTLDKNTDALLPILKKYGFKQLKKLAV